MIVGSSSTAIWRGAVAARWRLLGSAWFLAAVVVLVVNDHVLKPRYESWWTGKLSDVAGPVVIAVVLAVPLGRSTAVAATAVAFAALKTVPGVAEFVAPVLGGVTRRDASDLVGLAVLVLVWHQLGRTSRRGRREWHEWPNRERSVSAWRHALAAVVPIVGVTASVFATTATSCSGEPAVQRVVVFHDDLYALVWDGGSSDDWYTSHDGGDTWQAVDSTPWEPEEAGSVPRGRPPSSAPSEPSTRHRMCGSDGVCYRVRDQRLIERSDDGGSTWREERVLSGDEIDDAEGPCTDHRSVLTGIAVVDVDGEPNPVTTMATDGVLVQQSVGDWSLAAVGPAGQDDSTPIPTRLGFGILLGSGPVAVVAMALAALLGKRRVPLAVALQVVVVWMIAVPLCAGYAFLDHGNTAGWVALAAGMMVFVAAALAIRRSPLRSTPPSEAAF